MIRQYKEVCQKDQNVILDNYVLKNGVYFKLDINKPIEQIGEDEFLIVNNREDNVSKPELYKWFKVRDYYSGVLNDDMNKAIDLPAKKIHSTNYLTLFIKKDVFPNSGDKKALTIDDLRKRIEGYFNALEKGEEKFLEIYVGSNYTKSRLTREEKEEFLQTYFKSEVEYIRSTNRVDAIKRHKQYLLDRLCEIVAFVNKFSDKHEFSNYIKIFFNQDINIYEKESKIYTIPRIFNVNDYNLFTNQGILGLPSNNITTNSKKPFLLLRTMQCHVPFRSSAIDVEVTKNFLTWLKKQDYKGIKLDYDYKFDGTPTHKRENAYFNVHIDQSGVIDDFDNIPFDVPKLEFKFENVLLMTKKSEDGINRIVLPTEIIDDFSRLQEVVNECFFNFRMKGYLKSEELSIKVTEFTRTMEVLFLSSREAFYDFFTKGISISLKNMINKLSRELIDEQIKCTVKGFNLNRMRKAFNLRISFLKYFNIKGGTEMADKIHEIMERLSTKLPSTQTVVCESDEEFYFTAGQLAYYIMQQSKSHNKNFGIFEPFLIVKNPTLLKRKLAEMFEIYKHAISIQNIKFKNAFGMVMGYEPEVKMTDHMKDLFLAGLLSNNIFYTKNENKEEVAENGKNE
jgi:CRISPR-associated protein Csh1